VFVTDDQEGTETFNDHYINVMEKSGGSKFISQDKDTGFSDDRQVVFLILEKCKNNPSVLAIIHNPEQNLTFQEIENI